MKLIDIQSTINKVNPQFIIYDAGFDIETLLSEYTMPSIQEVHCINNTALFLHLSLIPGNEITDWDTTAIYQYTEGVSGPSKLVCISYNNLQHVIDTGHLIPHSEDIDRVVLLDVTKYHALSLLSGLKVSQHTMFASSLLKWEGLIITTKLHAEARLLFVKEMLSIEHPRFVKWFKNTWLYNKLFNRLFKKFHGNIVNITVVGQDISKPVKEAFDKVEFYNIYGNTETNHLISIYRNHALERFFNTCILEKDFGRLQVTGKGVGKYFNPELNRMYITTENSGNTKWLDTQDYANIVCGRHIILGNHPLLKKFGATMLNVNVEDMLKRIPYIKEVQFLHRNDKTILLIYPDIDAADSADLSIKELARYYEVLRHKLNKELPADAQIIEVLIYSREFEKTVSGEIKRFLYN